MNDNTNKNGSERAEGQSSLNAMLGCPFCGEQPYVNTLGTQLEFNCCCSMSFQKSDYLTLEERGTFSYETLLFSNEAEEKVMKIAIKQWNTRVQPNAEIRG